MPHPRERGLVTRVASRLLEQGRAILVGHTRQDEAQVQVILAGNITPDDIARYAAKTIQRAYEVNTPSIMRGGFSDDATLIGRGVNAVKRERERITSLTDEQLREEVRRDALRKASDWKILGE